MSPLLEYDEKTTLRRLTHLTPRARVVFALAITARLLPGYRRFHARTGRGDLALLETLTEKLWLDASFPGQMTLGDLEAAAARALECVPGEEDGWDQETQAYAEDVASALAYAYRARINGDPQEAAWAARCVFETIEFFIEQQPIGSLLRESPLMRAELGRQDRDLRDLAAWEKRAFDSEMLLRLRNRSEREAVTDIRQAEP